MNNNTAGTAPSISAAVALAKAALGEKGLQAARDAFDDEATLLGGLAEGFASLGAKWSHTIAGMPSAQASARLVEDVAPSVHSVPVKAGVAGLLQQCERAGVAVSAEAQAGMAFSAVKLAAPVLADRALDFLATLDPDPSRPWSLLRATATGGFVGPTICRALEGDGRAALRKWLVENIPLGSIYFHAGVLSPSFTGGKATKPDIAELRSAWFDFDATKDADLDAERERLKAFTATLAQVEGAAPAAVVLTGNGVQMHYRIQPVAGDAAMTAVEQAWSVLQGRIGSDKVANRDRLLRLPFTVNVPNEAKRRKGRDVVLALAVPFEAPADAVQMPFPDLHQRVTAWADEAGLLAPDAGVPLAGGDVSAEREAAARAELRAHWGEIAGVSDEEDWPDDLRERFDEDLFLHPTLGKRWRGDADGLTDTSRSGMVMALTGCLKAAGFGLLDAARVLMAYQHGDIQDDTKHPTAEAQQRAIARAWVRAYEQPAEEAERRKRLDDAQREAVERTLHDALPGSPELVRDMLPVCLDDKATSDAAFARNRATWAARAGLGVIDLKKLRASAVKAGAQARGAADLIERAAGRSIIDVGDGHDAVVDKSAKALAGQEPPRMFHAGDAVVEVVERAPSTADLNGAGADGANSGPATIPATSHVVRYAMARAAVYVRDGKPVDPPFDVAATVAARGPALRLPHLAGMLPAPAVRPDGSMAGRMGYDAMTGVYVTADVADLAAKVPADPTREDAQDAMRFLLAAFREFNFAPENGRSVFAAHMLTLLTRHLFPTAPLFIYSAPTKGSGKSLLAESPSRIVMGRPPTTMSALGGSNNDDETRKRFTSLLLASRTDVVFDNEAAGSAVGNTALDALLTSPGWSDRILGASQSVSIPNRLTLATTGNNLRVGADTGRRSLFSYLDPMTARPWERSGFAIPDLRGHLRRNRADLLAAALTVATGHMRRNNPLGGGCTEARTLGSFEDWARVVAAAVEWAGLENPIASQDWGLDQMDASEDQAAALEDFIAAAHSVVGPAKFTAGELLEAAEPEDDFAEVTEAQRELRQALHAVLENSGRGGDTNRRLGHFLRENAQRVTLGGWSIRDAGTRRRARCYQIARPGMDAQEGTELVA